MPAAKPKVKPVKLICGVLLKPLIDVDRLEGKLESRFGPIYFKSRLFPFIFTDYYEKEMGGGLVKQFYAFEKLVLPDSLADIKNTTIQIESELSSEGKRIVNLDPGYLEESKLVLASTKNFSHRIYLKDGIWAELTLSYAGGKFVAHPWTYPDYQTELAYDFLRETREIYINQLKSPK